MLFIDFPYQNQLRGRKEVSNEGASETMFMKSMDRFYVTLVPALGIHWTKAPSYMHVLGVIDKKLTHVLGR